MLLLVDTWAVARTGLEPPQGQTGGFQALGQALQVRIPIGAGSIPRITDKNLATRLVPVVMTTHFALLLFSWVTNAPDMAVLHQCPPPRPDGWQRPGVSLLGVLIHSQAALGGKVGLNA